MNIIVTKYKDGVKQTNDDGTIAVVQPISYIEYWFQNDKKIDPIKDLGELWQQQKKKAALEELAPKGMQRRARASRATSQGGHAAETPILIGSSDQSDDESSRS
jgi:hypothetical protein